MNKKFINSLGAELEITDNSINFVTRNVEVCYDEIESVKLKRNGSAFWVYREMGKCDFFMIDKEDREEFKELVKEIKARVEQKIDEDEVKANIKRYTRSDIGLTIFVWIFVEIMTLCGWFKIPVLSIILLLAVAFMTTWLANTCRRIVPKSVRSLKRRNIIIQIIIIVLCVGVSLGWFFYFKPGFRAGEYLNKECYWYNCDRPADGGMNYGGLYDSDAYYCKEHFAIEKEAAERKNGSSEPDEYDVWAIAKDEVRDNLKSPSTASFCSQSSATITKSGKTWTVIGYVDAQNSFGAEIRTNFKVVITFSGGDRYTATCTFD